MLKFSLSRSLDSSRKPMPGERVIEVALETDHCYIRLMDGLFMLIRYIL